MPIRRAAKMAMQQRILAVADKLFYERGIRATGVDTIASETGISKRTLYNHYPSKEALVSAYLSARRRNIAAPELASAREIIDVFDRLEQDLATINARGCPFVNAVAEAAEPKNIVRQVARDFKDNQRQWFRDQLIRLGVSVEADALAMQLMLLVDGAIATALVRDDPKVARSAKAAARTLLRRRGATNVKRSNLGQPVSRLPSTSRSGLPHRRPAV